MPTVWELYGSYIIGDDRGRDRPAAADRRAAAVARTPAPRRQHDPGEGSVAAHELRPHSPDGRTPDQRAGSGARRDRPRSARRRLPEADLGVDRRRQPEERHRQPRGSENAGGHLASSIARHATRSRAFAACRTTSIRRRFACSASRPRCARIATRSRSGTASRSSSPVRTASAPFIPTSRSASSASRRNRCVTASSTAARSR